MKLFLLYCMEEVKLKGSIFLSVKELMILTGRDLTSDSHYESARREHQAIRDSIAPKKKKLTVNEYCDFEKVQLVEVVNILNSWR